MSRDEKLAHLRAWHEAMTRSSAALQPVIDLLRLTGEDPITDTVWQLQTDLSRAYAALMGDTLYSLEWFAAENEMGRKGMDAGVEGNTRPIRTVEDLLWLLEVTN